MPIKNVVRGTNVKIYEPVNLYGCTIGDNTRIGAFVEITEGAYIGKNCKISSHSFICGGVTIGDNVFVGHGVVFINDRHPRATREDGTPEDWKDWKERFVFTWIHNNVSIGSNATILGGITIGEGAVIGCGSVVTKDVPDGETWCGNPARKVVK